MLDIFSMKGFVMKKVFFIWGAVITAFFALLSAFLLFQFEEYALQEFSLATCGFGISVFFFFDAKNAEKPMKDYSLVRNTLKRTLQSKNKLHVYKVYSYMFLAFSIYFGLSQFVTGVVKVIVSAS